MGSKRSKGKYYVTRTRRWLESIGYHVAILEQSRRVVVPGRDGKPDRVIYMTRDVWGADLVARNEDHLIFVQVKTSPGDVAKGMRDLSEGEWPGGTVCRWVVWWPERRRMADGPEIEEVRKEAGDER